MSFHSKGRSIAIAVVLFGIIGALDEPARTASPESTLVAEQTTALAEAYSQGFFDYFPELGTYYGIPGSRHDRLHDNSLAARQAWSAREDAWYAELQKIDASRLAGPERVTYGFLREALEYGGFLRESLGSGRETRVCRRELWALDQSSGWAAFFYPAVSTAQPVGTPELRAQALTRWRAFPRLIDTEVANLREGVRAGYTAPRRIAQVLIDQIDALVTAPYTASPFYSPAARDPSAAFKREWTALLIGQINPALRRYRDYLKGDYLRAAREDVGVAVLTRGEECYRARLRQFTTLDLSPAAVHAIGLKELAKVEADLESLRARIVTAPRSSFHSRAEMLAKAQAAVDRATREAPRWIGLLPKARLVIDPYLESEEENAGNGAYLPPARDGSRPGRYRLNLHLPEQQPQANVEVLSFHEAIPGHHVQEAIALERSGALTLTQHFYTTAFNEGWAVYCERLADEMGLYSSDLDRLGMLNFRIRRAARLVVDTGLHSKGWSREQAIDFLTAHLAEGPRFIADEVDSYIGNPGFATAYLIGSLEIERLRDIARRELGPRFSMGAFHGRVLAQGAGTLAMLQESITSWIDERR
jgi:uncharacterized protein (DUF885 family)